MSVRGIQFFSIRAYIYISYLGRFACCILVVRSKLLQIALNLVEAFHISEGSGYTLGDYFGAKMGCLIKLQHLVV